MQEQFLIDFLIRYKSDEMIKGFLESFIKLKYFNIIEMALNPILRTKTPIQKRGKFTSFYGLYANGQDELKDQIISKIIKKEGSISRYYCMLETYYMHIPFCIKYKGQTIALLYILNLKDQNYQLKIRSAALLKHLRSSNIKEVLYIYVFYVLHKFARKGHGKHIMKIIQSYGKFIVLCSASTSQNIKIEDFVGSGIFYRKSGFKEYYPIETLPTEQDDQGCLLQNKDHINCSPRQCQFPLNKYNDDSYYVYYPKGMQ